MKNHLLQLFMSLGKSPVSVTRPAYQQLAQSTRNQFRSTALNKKTGLSASLSVFAALILLLSFSGLKAQQITDKTTFPLNEYLYTDGITPYPKVNDSLLKTIDTSKFVNVMKYGAKGDGKTLDDIAIKNAFKAAQYGVIFPAGRTFLVSTVSRISLTHDLTIYAYGATIKMADLTKYTFLQLQAPTGSYHYKVMWLGGTFDGNQYNQVWPGNPHGGKYNGAFAESHGRFVGINCTEFAMFKDVTVLNTVVDGPSAESCKIAVFADSKASGGAPIHYNTEGGSAGVGEQGTYFKVTREGMKASYFLNLDCEGGSIATHVSYPTNSVMDNGILSVHVNVRAWNQAQDAIHIEDCYKNFFYNCVIGCDSDGGFYLQRLHLSNRSGVVTLKNCQFTNAYVNFNQATNLKLGLVDSCSFTGTKTNYLRNFINGRPHVVAHSSFSGICSAQQGNSLNARNCTFSNFGNNGIVGTSAVDSCTFINGTTPVTTAKDGFVVNTSFQQVKNTSYKTAPATSDWKKVFNSYVDVYSDAGKYLGRIDCGYSTTQTQSTSTAKATAAALNNRATTNFNGGTITNSTVAITTAAEISKKTSIPAQITRVYPNPAVNVLNVLMNEQITGKTALRIYDQQGRMVQTKMVDKQTAVLNETLNVQQLAAGVYILRIVSEHNQTDLKFIIAK